MIYKGRNTYRGVASQLTCGSVVGAAVLLVLYDVRAPPIVGYHAA
ncbi:hypothetical protein X750_31160 [Mesorhizobium sp. LNJC394B00]|nr:hypothetical protein X750_31160 [Mesorhizobium sp. LNJC394B00]